MEAANFNESNHVLDKPKDLDQEDCQALCVWSGPSLEGIPLVISCWKPTAEELAEINRTGRVWLVIWGNTMPPAALLGTSPFPPKETQ